MRKSWSPIVGSVAVTLLAFGCFSSSDDLKDGDENPTADGGLADGAPLPPPPGGEATDEQFPADLLDPYDGPPIDNYDNTFANFQQVSARVKQVFADTGIGGNTDTYLQSKAALFGTADFKTSFTETRTVTPDFLLALDGIARDACDRASTNKTGPFAGTDPANLPAGQEATLIGQLYKKMVFHDPSAQEVTDATALVAAIITDGATKASAWAGLCETLVRSPDSIFTLPPSIKGSTPDDRDRLELVKLANDFASRPPTEAEFASLKGKTVDERVDHYLALPEFHDTYFHKTRLRTESQGTPDSDEPARLWTYLVEANQPLQELITASYSVDEKFAKVERPAFHGPTGILTMKGYIASKPGLPHYNYPARVMSDIMGVIFDVPQDIVAMRVEGSVSATLSNTVCFSCHQMLTPLAHQRLAWADDGTHRDVDDDGKPIDDTDRGLVSTYPYKGKGMEAFSVKAAKKEVFFRQTFNSQYLFFVGRPMRHRDDERTVYYNLWVSAFTNNGSIKSLLKIIANNPKYLGR